MTATEPVIEILPPDNGTPTRAYLADVLVVTAPGRSPQDTCVDLFRTFPGLTLVVQPGPGHQTLVGVRDGTLLTFRPRRPGGHPRRAPTHRAWLTVARLAYAWWAAGVSAGSVAAGRAARLAGHTVQVGRWRPTHRPVSLVPGRPGPPHPRTAGRPRVRQPDGTSRRPRTPRCRG